MEHLNIWKSFSDPERYCGVQVKEGRTNSLGAGENQELMITS